MPKPVKPVFKRRKNFAKAKANIVQTTMPTRKILDPVDEAMNLYVNNIWQMYDRDGNGELDRREAKLFVQEMMNEMATSQLSLIDEANNKNSSDVEEEEELDEDGFEQIFKMLDTDKSGTIDKTEMFNYLKNICDI